MKDTDTVTKAPGSQNAGNSIVKIDTRYKLEKVAAKSDQCRPNIEYVKLAKSERFGNCAVATNGRSMAIVPIEVSEGDNEQGLISVEALKASRKNRPHEGMFMMNGNIELPGSVTFPRPETEIAYPDWTQVLPDQPIKFTVALNAKLLFELAQALGSDGAVTLRFSDELSPISVTSNHGGNGEFGVMMPMRIRG
jgi:hypothetical protein